MANADVSACLIVKDAQTVLPRCLESIVDLVKEVIVVDTGSTDATRSQADSAGCRVYSFVWTDDFSEARNESLRHATYRWILCLDADEYFDEPNRQKLRRLLASLSDVDAAFSMTQRSMLANGLPLDLVHTRLFRNDPQIRWQYRVHEQIAPSILRLGHVIRPTDIVFHHLGYDDPRVHRRKTERNARLLELDLRQHPDDTYLLFNLGTAYAELGKTAEAIALLRQTVQLSPAEYARARDAYVALVQCLRQLGQANEAWTVCLEGRGRYPQDGTLLYWHAELLRDQGKLPAAEQGLLELVRMAPAPSPVRLMGRTALLSRPDGSGEPSYPSNHAGGVAAGIRDCVAPHTLGLIYSAQGRVVEAEKQWQAVVGGFPFYKPSWQMLGELYLSKQRWAELDAVLKEFEGRAEWSWDGVLLRVRQQIVQKDFGTARAILEQMIAQAPNAIAPRFYLTHVLMAEGKDWPAAERALRDLLQMDPRQAQGWHNLAAVLRIQNRRAEALEACETGLKHCPGDANLVRLQQTIRGGK